LVYPDNAMTDYKWFDYLMNK